MPDAERLKSQISLRMLSAVLHCVFDGCAAAFDIYQRDYSDRPHRDAVPKLRRLEVEKRLRAVTADPGFSTTLHVESSASILRIEGPSIVLTSLTRSRYVERLPSAHYRRQLANKNQLTLFGYNPVSPGDSGKDYAVLVYGGRLTTRHPNLAYIGFPDHGGVLRFGTLDLLRELPSVVSQYSTPATGPEVKVKLKRERKPEQA